MHHILHGTLPATVQFLKFVEKAAPISVYTSGKGSSAAGTHFGCSVKSRVADAFLNADHSPLRDFQTLVDTALESSGSAISSAVSTSIWELRSGERVAFKNEPGSAGISMGLVLR